MTDNNIQIIIPMSGAGSRFVTAGYKAPKPLIKVHDRPIIEWIVKLFPEAADFTFICRKEHLDKTNMRDVLHKISPTGKVISIEEHKKGPVYSLVRIADSIDDIKPTIVSYCDYYMHWHYNEFIERVLHDRYDGAIPCYTGFHPHLIPQKNVYASCKIDSKEQLIEIREKFQWTKDKTKSLHSPGLYYFKSGALMKKYCKMLLDAGIHLNNEYYVSLVYNLMVQEGLNIWVPDCISKFCQWGTPQDLEEYLFWVNTVKGCI